MQVLDYWNERASLGKAAGTDDVIASELERRVILHYAADGQRVLDVGCGNGTTLAAIAARHTVEAVGVDFSPAMIEQARQQYPQLAWQVAALPDLPDLGVFDLVYTQRCLINLPDADTQRLAVQSLLRCVRPGGRYVMVENSVEGLATTNYLRAAVGLPAITPPWHNCYLREGVVRAWQREFGFPVRGGAAVASTYALLSRAVNAKLAADEGRTPHHQDPINHLALALPNIGDYGQNRVWVWEVDGCLPAH